MAGSAHNGDGPIAAINVTPLVDVMLVLLVIFMITAPMLQQGVEVNLPKASAGSLEGSDEQIVVSIDKNGGIFLGSGNEVSIEQLVAKVIALLAKRKDKRIYVQGDEALGYGKVMEVMAALHRGGITQIALVSDPLTGAQASNNKDNVKQDKANVG